MAGSRNQKDDEFERHFKAELAELEIDCKNMGVDSEQRSLGKVDNRLVTMVLRKMKLSINHIPRSPPGIDELVKFSAKLIMETNMLSFSFFLSK